MSDKPRLVCVIMGQDCEKFLPMCLDSIKSADAIVYLDGGSKDKSKEIARKYGEVIYNKYDQLSKKANGKQRNIYLNYIKEKYPDDWCLALDADEVVEDLNRVKEYIQTMENGFYSIRMRHLIQDLAHEDSIEEIHHVYNRLFKISEAGEYPEVEHPVLQGNKETKCFSTNVTIIWHLSHITEVFNAKRKYDNHIRKSNIHTSEFLKKWYYWHIFGTYPKKQFNPLELPDVILNYFGVNKDELYFANRGLELKHFIDAIHWRDFFKCKTAIEYGCGRGPRVYALNQIGIYTDGVEISEFAVNNKLHENICLGDILIREGDYRLNNDLVIAYDVLEHLDYKNLNKAITNLIESTQKHILISVPVIGDPNLENDPTHKIRETRDWWIKQFTDKNLELIETPLHFLYRDQILIFKKKDEI